MELRTSLTPEKLDALGWLKLNRASWTMNANRPRFPRIHEFSVSQAARQRSACHVFRNEYTSVHVKAGPFSDT